MNWQKLIWRALAAAFVLLQLALIAAKLTGRIHLSWWWTLTPLWSPALCVAVVAVIAIALFSNASANGENPFR